MTKEAGSLKQKVSISKKETLIEPVFEIIDDKQYWPATSWVYKPNWDNAGCSLEDDESKLSIVIINLANLRKGHEVSIPPFWIEHLGLEDATLEFVDFIFTRLMLHWACDGADREHELIDGMTINGKGEEMTRLSQWEQQLEKYDSLIEQLVQKREKGEAELRFNRPFIIASDIAEQYFCEKKVEMQYLHGEIETEEKTFGSEAHKKLLKDSIKIERKELWQKIYGKEPVFALEILLIAKYGDLVIAGRPDSILFRRGQPLVIFEYKFSKSRRLFRSHYVQVETYGILLRNMGFDTDNLFYAIVTADPKAEDDGKLKGEAVQAILKNGLKEAILTLQNARIYVSRFDQTKAERDLEWAIKFWKNQREPVPTRNLNKCKSCEYKTKCREKPS